MGGASTSTLTPLGFFFFIFLCAFVHVRRARLVPVFSFGENELFDQIQNPTGSPLRTLQVSLVAIVTLVVRMSVIALERGGSNLGFYRKVVNMKKRWK